jgi:hypothetical protein
MPMVRPAKPDDEERVAVERLGAGEARAVGAVPAKEAVVARAVVVDVVAVAGDEVAMAAAGDVVAAAGKKLAADCSMEVRAQVDLAGAEAPAHECTYRDSRVPAITEAS